MRFITFCRLLGLALCGNAVIVYAGSNSIPLAVVTTLACSLLLQVFYFASVLFLIWRSSCSSGGGPGAEQFGGCSQIGTSRRTTR
ncbi:exopolysaccharide production repressor protein [Mesorhizobium neociceri]|uniref:Exopolysaccharide production repressor protein n=1 Tax=Mesorhizobium neociceri TaxID=1307853 RepID=A0A838BBL1_9HYPH|nr:exopolysaccharide production repressor protein [Mesorhizobium neociceri]MBA1143825.1 exopolysaccharide production repressor protein [Mesorhizobium neociceri]